MNYSQSNASTRSKLLIPALLLVLLLVLAWPSRKGESVQPVSEHSRPVTNNSGTKSHLTSVALLEPGSQPAPPTYRLVDAISINPFDMPTSTAAVATTAQPQETMLEPLGEIAEDQPPVQPAPVQLQAIFFDRSGAAALIEDQIYRIGDQLSDGHKIVRITRQGVELAP